MVYGVIILGLFTLGYFNKRVLIDWASETTWLPEPVRPPPPEPRGLKDLENKEVWALVAGLTLVSCVWGYAFYSFYVQPQPIYELEVRVFEVIDQPWAPRWDLIYSYGQWYFFLEGDWTWVPQNTTLILMVQEKATKNQVPVYYVKNWRVKNE